MITFLTNNLSVMRLFILLCMVVLWGVQSFEFHTSEFRRPSRISSKEEVLGSIVNVGQTVGHQIKKRYIKDIANMYNKYDRSLAAFENGQSTAKLDLTQTKLRNLILDNTIADRTSTEELVEIRNFLLGCQLMIRRMLSERELQPSQEACLTPEEVQFALELKSLRGSDLNAYDTLVDDNCPSEWHKKRRLEEIQQEKDIQQILLNSVLHEAEFDDSRYSHGYY